MYLKPFDCLHNQDALLFEMSNSFSCFFNCVSSQTLCTRQSGIAWGIFKWTQHVPIRDTVQTVQPCDWLNNSYGVRARGDAVCKEVLVSVACNCNWVIKSTLKSVWLAAHEFLYLSVAKSLRTHEQYAAQLNINQHKTGLKSSLTSDSQLTFNHQRWVPSPLTSAVTIIVLH